MSTMEVVALTTVLSVKMPLDALTTSMQINRLTTFTFHQSKLITQTTPSLLLTQFKWNTSRHEDYKVIKRAPHIMTNEISNLTNQRFEENEHGVNSAFDFRQVIISKGSRS